MSDITDKALEFIESVSKAVHDVKPSASAYEVIGTIYLILNRTIETQLNEQLPKSSESESEARVDGESGEVPGTGTQGRLGEGTERVRKEQAGTTARGKKKRR